MNACHLDRRDRTRHGKRPSATQHGVTLIELVVVITLIAVMASIGATLVSRIVAGQQDNHGRLALAQAADGAMARIANELDSSLPNSVRVTVNAGGTWIEWVPVQDVGRYRQAPDTVSGTPGDLFDPTNAADNSFDVIGIALATPPAGAQIAWSGLAASESDVYIGTTRRAGLVISNAGRHVSFAANGALPADNGSARFFIVGNPITLACRTGTSGALELQRHSGYGWRATQPVSTSDIAGSTAVVLLGQLFDCSAAYGTALANIGLLNLRIGVGDGVSTARMDYLQQLPVDNAP